MATILLELNRSERKPQGDKRKTNSFVTIPVAGTKIFVATEPKTPGIDSLLKTIYELYTDYVLKNPFYEVEMPIRCELWDLNLALAVRKDNKGSLVGR